MQKITIFILRNMKKEILVFRHEDSSIQIPAGTIEEGESIIESAIREMYEETGINRNEIENIEELDTKLNELLEHEVIIEKESNIFSRSREDSINWIKIRKGITVNKIREQTGYSLIEYREWNNEIEKDYFTYEICGWINSDNISHNKIRNFVVINVKTEKEIWNTFSDCHTFNHYFVNTKEIPKLLPNQERWKTVLNKYLENNHLTIAST